MSKNTKRVVAGLMAVFALALGTAAPAEAGKPEAKVWHCC